MFTLHNRPGYRATDVMQISGPQPGVREDILGGT
jgi:hypothetical protein